MQDMKLEQWPLEKLIPYVRNPRKNDHAVEQVAAAIREFGFRVPVIAKSDGTIVDGHLRLKAAQRLGMETVPVINADDMTEVQIKAFRISVNRMAELAEWDLDMLKLELEDLKEMDFDLELTGLDGDMVKDLLNAIEGTAGETDPDDVPEPPVEPVTRPGDLYLLGRHRLLCGDSTNITDTNKVLNGAIPDLSLYDPPYDMDTAWDHSYPAQNIMCFHDYKSIAGAISAIQGKPYIYQFVWDCGACWWTPNRPLARHKSCLIGMESPQWLVDEATFIDGKKRVAKTVTNTRGDCDYVPLSGGRVRMSTVFLSPTAQENSGHKHSKPVNWVKALIAGTGAQTVLDQFAGSGTGIIACEMLGISCLSVELEPRQCDVIVSRWEAFTGKTVELQK